VYVDNGATISQVTVSAVTATTAWVSWSTDSYSDSQVEFGPTSAYGSSAPVDASLTWLHRQLLTGLTPGATYHYRVRSRDLRGAVGVSGDATFTTRLAISNQPSAVSFGDVVTDDQR
jgi:purple acid phosphatase-like protein